jgi:hypothetical protein
MNEPEKDVRNFLARWSKRKLAAHEESAPSAAQSEQAGDASPAENDDAARTPSAAPQLAAENAPELPPIESINALTDIRAFLAPGVPVELQRAALRRAWAADPAIRDFIGIAENQWDFTDPQGAPGFGTLEITDELRRMVARLTGETAPQMQQQQTTAPVVSSSPSDEAREPAEHAGSEHAVEQPGTDPHAALQDDTRAKIENSTTASPCEMPAPQQRARHGGALPK